MTFGKLLNRGAVCLVAGLLLAGCAGLLLFKFVQRKIATNMQQPHLRFRPVVAKDLVYRILTGEQQHLVSTKGQVVVLDLWGTWCVQCVAEMPTVHSLYNHYKDNPQVKFLVISRLDALAAVRFYARRNHLDLPFYITEDEDIPSSMQLNQYPSTLIFAKDGSLVSKHLGAADWSDRSVISFINQLKRRRWKREACFVDTLARTRVIIFAYLLGLIGVFGCIPTRSHAAGYPQN